MKSEYMMCEDSKLHMSPSLFQFGVFFKWTCGEEIYSTNDDSMKYNRTLQRCERIHAV